MFFPPGVVQCLRLAHLQNAHANRRFRIIKTDRQKPVFAIIDHRQLAGRAFAVLFQHTVAVNPGMTAPDIILRRRRNS